MISIIVSSYKEDLFYQFEKNVIETIGVAYELIRVANPGIMGICEAYNKGAKEAQYEFLCFCHEDIIFDTNNWGRVVIEHFRANKELGLIGVAGSSYKPFMLSGWGSVWGKYATHFNLRQYDKKANRVEELIFNLSETSNFTQTVTLDGCFLLTTRKVYNEYQFDEQHFRGYHCYDIDYSLQVQTSYKIGVISNIAVTHYSMGSFDYSWYEETIKLHHKWRDRLPVFIGHIPHHDIETFEYGAFYSTYEKIIPFKRSTKQLRECLMSKRFLQIVGLKKWLWINLKFQRKLLRYP